MAKCPLIKSRNSSSSRPPKLNGRTLATLLAFGMGVLMATSASWRVDSINEVAKQAAAERAATEAEMSSVEFDSTPFMAPILADNN